MCAAQPRGCGGQRFRCSPQDGCARLDSAARLTNEMGSDASHSNATGGVAGFSASASRTMYDRWAHSRTSLRHVSFCRRGGCRCLWQRQRRSVADRPDRFDVDTQPIESSHMRAYDGSRRRLARASSATAGCSSPLSTTSVFVGHDGFCATAARIASPVSVRSPARRCSVSGGHA